MSNYSPTAADYKFLMDHHPEVYADRVAARRVLDQLAGGGDAPNMRARLDALGNNYSAGGNPVMTKSPIPPGPGIDTDGNFDPAFAALCVDCQPNEPCCLTAGTVMDFADPSRRIEWPATGDKPPTRLLIVAKDVRGEMLSGKVRIRGEGRDCMTGHPRRSLFLAQGSMMRDTVVRRSGADLEVGYPKTIGTALAMKDFVPEQALLFLMVVDTLTSAAAMVAGSDGITVTPVQCVGEGSMTQAFRVVPFPYFEASGDATVSVGVHFLTTGIGGNASIEGNLTGKYGHLDISAAARASARPSSGRGQPSPGEAPGIIGTIASIIGNFSESVSLTSPRPGRIVDRTGFGSGVRFDMALKLAGTGIKLEAKKATPDLEAKLGSLETSLTMTATGTMDVVDLAAQVMLSPAGARLVQEARATMATKSHAVRGEVRAEISVSAQGKLTHKIDSNRSVLIPANAPVNFESEDMSTEFGGKLTVRGEAMIRLHVEGEVWIVSAEAGVQGTLHTGWIWEMKVDAEKKRKKRYYFEGLKARATGYVRLGASSSHSNSARSRDLEDYSSSRKVTMTQQGPSVTAGDRNWNDPNAKRSELESEGAVYVLLSPTVERVTSAAPPWSNY